MSSRSSFKLTQLETFAHTVANPTKTWLRRVCFHEGVNATERQTDCVEAGRIKTSLNNAMLHVVKIMWLKLIAQDSLFFCADWPLAPRTINANDACGWKNPTAVSVSNLEGRVVLFLFCLISSWFWYAHILNLVYLDWNPVFIFFHGKNLSSTKLLTRSHHCHHFQIIKRYNNNHYHHQQCQDSHPLWVGVGENFAASYKPVMKCSYRRLMCHRHFPLWST